MQVNNSKKFSKSRPPSPTSIVNQVYGENIEFEFWIRRSKNKIL